MRLKNTIQFKMITLLVIYGLLFSNVSWAGNIDMATGILERNNISPSLNLSDMQLQAFFRNNAAALTVPDMVNIINSPVFFRNRAAIEKYLRNVKKIGNTAQIQTGHMDPASGDNSFNNRSEKILQNTERRRNSPQVHAVYMNPAPSDNMSINWYDEFEVEIIVAASIKTDFKKDGLQITLSFGSGYKGWKDIAIPSGLIKLVCDEQGKIIPGVFAVTYQGRVDSPGEYEFTVKAKTKYQTEAILPERIDGQRNVFFQARLLPEGINLQKTHPYYVPLMDMGLTGYESNWEGIRDFVLNVHAKTGKNVFMYSPVFPTPSKPPFTSLTVAALSPQFIKWDSVQEEGSTLLEKYNSFLRLPDQDKRRKQFALFSSNKFEYYQDAYDFAEFTYFKIRNNEDIVYGREYGQDVVALAQAEQYEYIIGALMYEMFINLEQFMESQKKLRDKGIMILFDNPFYRSVMGVDIEKHPEWFVFEAGKVCCAGAHGNDPQIWQDLAAWNELGIEKYVENGGEDPRIRSLKFFNVVFKQVFKKEGQIVSGARLDALYYYGRDTYKNAIRRINGNTYLWDEIAKYAQESNLLVIAEQLGGDEFAQDYFNELGFLQYGLVLDYQSKMYDSLFDDLADKSRGVSWTSIATHDSMRTAQEYLDMFTYLANLDQGASVNDILETASGALQALFMLSSKMEPVLLGLDELNTLGQIKTEYINKKGEVSRTEWGSKKGLGEVDISSFTKQYVRIREDNPAISYSEAIMLDNNDERLFSFAKAYKGNNLIVAGNPTGQTRKIKCRIPMNRFGIVTPGLIVFNELMTGTSYTMNGVEFEYELKPGQVGVFQMVSSKNDIQGWIEEYIAPNTSGILSKEGIAKLAEKLNQQVNTGRGKSIEEIIVQYLNDSSASKTEFAGFEVWDWLNNKNKEVMLHANRVMVIKNMHPFIVHLKNNAAGKESFIPVAPLKDNGEYKAMFIGLTSGTYTMTFVWPDGWEGRDYHFRVLPKAEDVSSRVGFNELSLKVVPEEAIYPHNTVTITNLKSSALRMSAQPIQRHKDDYDQIVNYTSTYEGFQANLFENAPGDRRILFRNTLDDLKIDINGQEKEFNLAGENFKYFERYPLPAWRFEIAEGNEKIVIDKKVVLDNEKNIFTIRYEIISVSPGISNIRIYVRPDLEMRGFHDKTFPNHNQGHWDSQHNNISLGDKAVGFKFGAVNEVFKSWHPNFSGIRMHAIGGKYEFSSQWHYSYHPIEPERRQDAVRDSYSPGFFTLSLSGENKQSSLVFAVEGADDAIDEYTEKTVTALFAQNTELLRKMINEIPYEQARQDSFAQKLVIGLRQFIVRRGEFFTVIAGYPWFADWGRDTFICFEGILESGMLDTAKSINKAFAKFENNGKLPNITSADNVGNDETVDAPLLYVLAVRDYIKKKGNSDILREKIDAGSNRTILEVVESIIEGYRNGMYFEQSNSNIVMHKGTKLIWSSSHFTWMDTNHPAGTPREGYTVENNARWYDCLMFLSEISSGEKAAVFKQIADEVRKNFNKYFWFEKGGYLADVLEGYQPSNTVELNVSKDIAIRPNQLIAVLSEHDLLSKEKQKQIVEVVRKELLVPGGLRTLAEGFSWQRTFSTQFDVLREGCVDSSTYDYRGYADYYTGDENARKLKYHNGTVWPHLFGDFAQSYVKAHGNSQEAKDFILPYFAPLEEHLNIAGVGSVSEIADANFPHNPKGCDAQGWSVMTNLAAYLKIKYGNTGSSKKEPLDIKARGLQDKTFIERAI